MDFPIHIDTISKGLSIGYFQGVTGIIVLNLDVFLSLKVVLISANSVDPDDMKHYDAFHLGLHCLPKYVLCKGLFCISITGTCSLANSKEPHETPHQISSGSALFVKNKNNPPGHRY